jgi:hypothetical protein
VTKQQINPYAGQLCSGIREFRNVKRGRSLPESDRRKEMTRPKEPEDWDEYYRCLKRNPKEMNRLKQCEIPLEWWQNVAPGGGRVIDITDEKNLNFANGMAMAASGCLLSGQYQYGICVFREGKGNIPVTFP